MSRRILLRRSAFLAPFCLAANAAFYYVTAAFAFLRNASFLLSVCQVIKAVQYFIFWGTSPFCRASCHELGFW